MAVKITIQSEFSDKGVKASIKSMDDFNRAAQVAGGGFSGYGQVVGKVTQQVGKNMADAGDTMTRNVTVPLAAVGAGLAMAAKAAAEDEAAASQLSVALKNNAKATDAQVKSVEGWISKQTLATGIADDQLRPALARLTMSTKDIGEAQKMTSLAMEISTAKHLDLTTVSNALAKANDGQFNALKKLGITLGDQTTAAAEAVKVQKSLNKAQQEAALALQEHGPKSKEYAKALAKVDEQQAKLNATTKTGTDWMGELGTQFKGALSADAKTAEGQMRRLTTSLNETKEELGYALLPIMKDLVGLLRESLVPMLQSAVKWFTSLSPETQRLILGMGALAAAIGPVLSVTGRLTQGVGTLITGLSNAPAAFAAVKSGATALWGVLAANPFLAIAAVVAVVAVLVITHWDTVKAKLSAIWGVITTTATAAWEWVKNTVETVMTAIVALATNWTIVGQIVKHWDAVKAGATAAWNWVKNAVATAFRAIVGLAMNWTIVGQVIKHWDQIKAGAKAAWDKVVEFFKDAPDRITTALGNLSKLLVDAGKDLVAGLWNGIRSAWSGLMGKVGDLASGLTDKVKSLFGISSPSRVFMTIGKQIGQGLEVGITSTSDAVKSAAEKVTKKAVDAVQAYQDKVADLKSRTKDLMGSWGIGEMASVTNVTAESILGGLASQIAVMKGFAANIQQATAKGLAGVVTGALLAAGPAAAAGQAAAFAGMTTGQVLEYNRLYAEQSTVARGLARTELGAPVKPNVNIQAGAVQVHVNINGNSTEDEITAAVTSAFDKLVRELSSK